MIILGTKGREIEIGTGTFYCPKCDHRRPYTRKKVARYFTLFFIPLLEINKLGEYLQCADCNTTYKPDVLNIKSPSPVQRQVLSVERDLASGTPLQMAQTKLINAGMDTEAAAQIVNQAAAEEIRECDECQLTYIADITKCSNCGKQLSLPKMMHKGRSNIS